jgi:predicted RNA-binding Zn-ribbon protein involved in translation (DUF1610 family)
MEDPRHKKDDDFQREPSKSNPKEAPTSEPSFQNKSVKFECPYCEVKSITRIEFRPSVFSFIILAIAMLLVNFLITVLLIPFIFYATKTAVHKCPNCGNQVGKDKRLVSLLNFDDEILTFSLGETAVICTRKIILVIIGVIVVIFIGFVKIQTIHIDEGEPITTTWLEFKEVCGRQVILDRDLVKYRQCEYDFLGKMVVDWSGYVIKINDMRDGDGYLVQSSHAVNVLLKLDPSESEVVPDLVLTVSHTLAKTYEAELSQLERGMQMGFNATLMGLGNELQIRHGHLNSVWVKQGFIEIPEHMHFGSRYSS